MKAILFGGVACIIPFVVLWAACCGPVWLREDNSVWLFFGATMIISYITFISINQKDNNYESA